MIRDSDDDGIPDQLDPESSGKNGGSCAIAPANKAASGWTGLIYLAIPALVILRRKLRRMEK